MNKLALLVVVPFLAAGCASRDAACADRIRALEERVAALEGGPASLSFGVVPGPARPIQVTVPGVRVPTTVPTVLSPTVHGSLMKLPEGGERVIIRLQPGDCALPVPGSAAPTDAKEVEILIDGVPGATPPAPAEPATPVR